jgi:hypothetical protein
VTRRFLGLLILSSPALFPADAEVLRGKLTKNAEDKAALDVAGKIISLSGDDDTIGVLSDKRLAGADLELHGKAEGAGFAVNPIHTRGIFVHKDGKRLSVTYWCDVCAIRTYTPGICWCCREETALDLRALDKAEKK